MADSPGDTLNEEQKAFYAEMAAAPKPTGQFAAYLAFIAQCRVEAMRLAGGDPDKAAPIFDRILEVWHQSQRPAAPPAPPLPFPQPAACIQKKTTG